MEIKKFYENKPIKDDSLNDYIKNSKGRNLDKIISRNSQADIIFKQYIGVIKYNDYVFTILPKIWEGTERKNYNLIYLFTYGLIPHSYIEKHADWFINRNRDIDILDFLMYLFSYSLNEELDKGLYMQYVMTSDNSRYLRGRMDIARQVNKIDKSRFEQVYYQRTADNYLNNFLAYCNEYFMPKLTLEQARSINRNISSIFNTELSRPYEHQIKNYTFNRLNERFEIPFNIASIIMKYLSPSSQSSETSQTTSMFLFDMNWLFEKFIFNFLHENRKTIFPECPEINLQYQKSRRNFIFEGQRSLKLTKPDIIIQNGNNRKIIIDVKYKEIKDLEISTGEEKNICERDLYQMFAYSELYEVDTILCYPYMKADPVQVRGPFLFKKNGNRKIWLMGVKLDFEDNWENKTIERFKSEFGKMLSCS